MANTWCTVGKKKTAISTTEKTLTLCMPYFAGGLTPSVFRNWKATT